MLDEEERECLRETLKLLQKTRAEIDKIWEGIDLACFDVDIDLKVKVDEGQVRVKDSWKRISEM